MRNFGALRVYLLVAWLFVPGILFLSPISVYGKRPFTFEHAKKLAEKLFDNDRKTLYCGCQYDADKTINLLSCKMEEAILIERARRVEWEHMMPASRFGGHLQCWQNPICESKGKSFKGRKCCKRLDTEFRTMESELYNMWPSVGLVNQARSNYAYGTIHQNDSYYGCSVKIDKLTRKIEPNKQVKGIVARANLFMAYFYGIELSKIEKKLYLSWHKAYPPNSREKAWATQVAQIEGYENPFVMYPEAPGSVDHSIHD